MKKVLLTLIGLAVFCMTSFAQEAEACDGSRYLAGGVFDAVSMSTVIYGRNSSVTGNEQDLGMDIYQPEGDMASKRPVIVLAHGGSFIFGTRGDMAAVATEYAKMGYVAVSVTYRLYPVVELGGLPDETEMVDEVMKAVGDMKAAIRFLRMDAATDNIYKIDPDHILVGGVSAGAITAMHLAQLGENDSIPDYVQVAIDANGGLEGNSGNPGFSSEVEAVVNLSGGLHDKNWLDADDVPFISMHGDLDDIVPFNSGLAGSVVFIDGSGNCHPVADSVGVANYLVTVPGGGHTNIYDPSIPNFEPFQVDFRVNGNLFLHTILCPGTPVNTNELLEKEITVYPNPAINQMTIDLGTIEAMYDLVVYDQVGKVVYKAYNLNDNQITLNKADFGVGLFVAEIRVMDEGIQSITRKVIFK